MATNNSLFGMGGGISTQNVVYGPDGKMYGNPAIARAAGVTNYTMSKPAYKQTYVPNNNPPVLIDENTGKPLPMRYGDPIYGEASGRGGGGNQLIGRVGMVPVITESPNGRGAPTITFADDPTYQKSQKQIDFEKQIASGAIASTGMYENKSGGKGERAFEDRNAAYQSYDPATNMVRFYDPEGNITQEGQRTSSGGGFFNQIGQGFNQIVSQPDVQKAIMLAALGTAAYGALGVPGIDLGLAGDSGLLVGENAAGSLFSGAGVPGAGTGALNPAGGFLSSLGGGTAAGTTAGTIGANAAGSVLAPGSYSLAGAGTGLLSPLGTAAGAAAGAAATGLSAYAPSLITGGLGLLGASNTAEKAREAAQTQAAAQVEAARIAADAAKFRPVGVTTRFGASNFQTDAQGNVIGAGYTASPEIQAYQNRLSALASQGLTGAEGAAAAYAPLTAGAQSLFNLGQGYIQETPEQQAAAYIAKQQALLAPGQEQQLALLQNKLFQQGRGGATVAQGGTMAATSPELAAYYNALAQSNLQLAAQGQQAGMEQARFGAGLLGTGSDLMGKYYGGQTAAYAPFATAMDTSSGLESLAQQPLTLSTQIGAKTTASAAEAGRLLSQGMISSAATQAPANAFSQSGNILGQFGSNPQLLNALNTSFGVTDPNQVAMQALLKKIYGT